MIAISAKQYALLGCPGCRCPGSIVATSRGHTTVRGFCQTCRIEAMIVADGQARADLPVEAAIGEPWIYPEVARHPYSRVCWICGHVSATQGRPRYAPAAEEWTCRTCAAAVRREIIPIIVTVPRYLWARLVRLVRRSVVRG
jgi:hypothetical protein